MMIREGHAPPCVVCRTTGGYADRFSHQPVRVQGRCNKCHQAWRKEQLRSAPDGPRETCEHCGRSFPLDGRVRRFCSHRCSTRYAIAQAKARLAGRSKPCRQCKTPMRPEDFRSVSDWYNTNFCSARCQSQWHGLRHSNTPHIPTGLVTIGDIGLDPDDLAAGARAAAGWVDEQARLAEGTAYTWMIAHPHQFTAAALARLFPHPGGLAAARWTTPAGAKREVAA